MIHIPFKYRGTTDAKAFMLCPNCKSSNSCVFNSGAVQYFRLEGIGRERACKDCNTTWRTIEMSVSFLAESIKDGRLDVLGLAAK